MVLVRLLLEDEESLRRFYKARSAIAVNAPVSWHNGLDIGGSDDSATSIFAGRVTLLLPASGGPRLA